jgi:hypothetical protein
MTNLTPGQLYALIQLVDENNQYNDDEDTHQYWQEVSDALRADYDLYFTAQAVTTQS